MLPFFLTLMLTLEGISFTLHLPQSRPLPLFAVYLRLPLGLCVKGQEMKRIALWFQQ